MATKKDYSLKGAEKVIVHYREDRQPTNEFLMSGKSIIELWGGGEGNIEMDTVEFQADTLTKSVMYANLNDGMFGCQDILSANVTVDQKIIVKRVFVDENGEFNDNNAVEVEQWSEVVSDLYISKRNDFDEEVGHPTKGIGRGGYEYKGGENE